MADSKKASLILELKDMASAGIAKVTGAMGSLVSVAAGVTAGLAVLFAGMMKALAAYGEQEAAIVKFNIALANQDIKSKAVTDDLIKFSQQLQNTTTYADEAVLGAMALGVTFGLTGERLKATTRAAADMSSALGIDLKTTMMLLGKASVGETGTLTRYGIVISENVPKAERFAAALAQVNARFGGSAAAQADTYAGKMAQLKNTFDDLLEVMGARFATPATNFLKWIKEATIATANYIGLTEKTTGVYGSQIDSVNKLIAAQERRMKINGTYFSNHPDELKKENEKLETLKKSVLWYEKQNEAKAKADISKATAGAKAPAIIAEEDTESEKKQAKLLQDAQNEIDSANMTEQQLFEIKTVSMAMELEAMGRHDEAVKLTQLRRTEFEKKQNEDRAKNLRSTLGTIATLSNSHNKTLAAIGKTAAITTATMDTYAAANVALRSAPPPWNFALAALVTAAGMANVANIAGVKLAEGGMIMPRGGGTSAIMAEAGKAEVAIPLDDERTKEKLRDVMGGGGNTIVIQAGAIVADDYSLNEFVNKIDEKLYERQRNRRSYL